MARQERWAAGLLVLAMLGTTAAWAQTTVAGKATAAEERSQAAADYESGFSDGLNAKDPAERRSSAYRDGYRRGQVKHRANESRPGGRDYARGYREGFAEADSAGKPKEAKNETYVAGHREGMTDRGNLRARIAAASPTPTSPDNMVGRPASSIERDMKALGFERTSGFKKGGESFSTWQSRAQNRCVRVMAREGRVKELTNVDNDRCL